MSRISNLDVARILLDPDRFGKIKQKNIYYANLCKYWYKYNIEIPKNNNVKLTHPLMRKSLVFETPHHYFPIKDFKNE